MQHTDYLSKTEDSIYFVIDKLKCYTEEGFIASLYVRKYSDLKVSMRLTEVRQCLSIVHFEYLNLVDYSLRFNKLWATDDNNRFTTAQRMFRMLKTSMESLKREFRKSCPISRSKLPEGQMKISVFEDSVLTRGGCARDLFGIESFKDNIQALFYEQRALFTNVLASLLVCRGVIRQEEIIRADKDHCVELLVKQCEDIINDMKGFIQFTQAPVTCEIQKLIDEIGLGDAAQRGFHKFGVEDVTEYAMFLNAQRHQPNVVSLNIRNCYQKSENIRMLFKYFMEFRPEPTKKKPSALKVLYAVNWMGNTDQYPLRSCYDLLANHLKGVLPTWHTVSTKKNDIPDLQEQQQLFNAELDAFIAQKKVEEGKSKAS